MNGRIAVVDTSAALIKWGYQPAEVELLLIVEAGD
jgi:hypothetical protein